MSLGQWLGLAVMVVMVVGLIWWVVYVVKKGDTLWDIAKAFAVTPSDLKEWNDLARNKIVAGQELVIKK